MCILFLPFESLGCRILMFWLEQIKETHISVNVWNKKKIWAKQRKHLTWVLQILEITNCMYCIFVEINFAIFVCFCFSLQIFIKSCSFFLNIWNSGSFVTPKYRKIGIQRIKVNLNFIFRYYAWRNLVFYFWKLKEYTYMLVIIVHLYVFDFSIYNVNFHWTSTQFTFKGYLWPFSGCRIPLLYWRPIAGLFIQVFISFTYSPFWL